MTTLTLQQAYQHCQHIVRNHYENFPVASWFLPKKLRLPISVIYAFARHADDLADEGTLSDHERYKALEQYQSDFEKALEVSYSDNPILFALTDVIKNHQLPSDLFFDLLTAFKMDTKTKRYLRFDDILNYCHYSANPVGRLLLHLHRQHTAENLKNSDAICSALQLINFYQDIYQDKQENNRIYIPTEELLLFNVNEQHFSDKINDENMQRLMQHQLKRAKDIMLSGTPLGRQLSGLFGLEIRLIIQGGLAITQKLQKIPNVFDRPRLTKPDKFVMLWRALCKINIIQ